jgi:glycosyltransferase involved in cell wall biosynthesis
MQLGLKRVALLCQHFYPELISTGIHMTELAEELQRRGWQVHVYCARPTLDLEGSFVQDTNEDFFEFKGIRVTRVPTIGGHKKGLSSRLVFALSYLVGIVLAVLREHRKFDGVLVTTNPPFLGVASRIVARFVGKPYVLIIYDVFPEIAIRLGVVRAGSLLARVWDRMTRFMLMGAARIVVIGRDMAKIIEARVDDHQNRIELVPNWSDSERIRPVPVSRNRFRESTCAASVSLVQYSGRMGRTHNVEPLIEAASLLAGQPVKFQFIGDGAKKRSLQTLAEEKGLTNVQFLPYQPMENLDEVLSAADVGVVCLGSEFTGLSVPSKAYGIMASGTALLGFLDPASEIGITIRENDIGTVSTPQ